MDGGGMCALCSPTLSLSNRRQSSSTPITAQPIRCKYCKTQFLPSSHPIGAVWNKVRLHFDWRQEASNPILWFAILFLCKSRRRAQIENARCLLSLKALVITYLFHIESIYVRRIEALSSRFNLKTRCCLCRAVLCCLLGTELNKQERQAEPLGASGVSSFLNT